MNPNHQDQQKDHLPLPPTLYDRIHLVGSMILGGTLVLFAMIAVAVCILKSLPFDGLGWVLGIVPVVIILGAIALFGVRLMRRGFKDGGYERNRSATH